MALFSSLRPVIVGNPFSPTGRGVTALSHFRALNAAGVPVQMCDVFSREHAIQADPGIGAELGDRLVAEPGRSINIYHLNANEIRPALEHLYRQLPDGAYNILYPFWELGRFPQEWAAAVKLFDEVWAPSRFIEESVRQVTQAPVVHMPLPVEIRLRTLLDRSYFGLPESSYIFLFFFDFRSYLDRKNPQALLAMVERLLAARPYKDVRVVIKVHGTGVSEQAARDYARFTASLRKSSIASRVIIIDRVYSDNEMKNLVRCCDCFVSLHRSEGFGLGLAEAMYLEKPVIGTGYSGNMDFMSPDNAYIVNYSLVPVQPGQYPHPEDQVWAEPDVEQAAGYASLLLDDPGAGRELGRCASRHMRAHFSYLALGLRYRERLQQIAAGLPDLPADAAIPLSTGAASVPGGQPRTEPIIVYQMGKVGSATVQHSILESYRALGLEVPVHHIHNLNNLEAIQKGLLERAMRGLRVMDTLEGVEMGLAVRKQIDADPNQVWNIVTLVRDPVTRSVSAFFQALPQLVPDWKPLYAAGHLTIEDLQQLFLERFNGHEVSLTWFERQMEPVFGIDVYSYPFPKSQGYLIYPKNRNTRLMLIRLEDLQRVAAKAFHEFLGLDQFQMVNANVGEDKEYREVYREFRQRPLPGDFLAHAYGSRLATHFYTPGELANFSGRWMPG